MAKPTREQMRSLLRYEPSTGDFYWKIRRGWVPAGAKAGTLGPDGYIKINVFGWPRKAHRIAWLFVTGDWPPDGIKIDHINSDRADNRIGNLRLVTDLQNAWNVKAHRDSSHGHKGLTWIHDRQKWQVRICKAGRRKTVGYFADLYEAKEAYRLVAEAAFGEFARSE